MNNRSAASLFLQELRLSLKLYNYFSTRRIYRMFLKNQQMARGYCKYMQRERQVINPE